MPTRSGKIYLKSSNETKKIPILKKQKRSSTRIKEKKQQQKNITIIDYEQRLKQQWETFLKNEIDNSKYVQEYFINKQKL